MPDKKVNLTEVAPEGISHTANEEKDEKEKKIQDLTEVRPSDGTLEPICG